MPELEFNWNIDRQFEKVEKPDYKSMSSAKEKDEARKAYDKAVKANFKAKQKYIVEQKKSKKEVDKKGRVWFRNVYFKVWSGLDGERRSGLVDNPGLEGSSDLDSRSGLKGTAKSGFITGVYVNQEKGVSHLALRILHDLSSQAKIGFILKTRFLPEAMTVETFGRLFGESRNNSKRKEGHDIEGMEVGKSMTESPSDSSTFWDIYERELEEFGIALNSYICDLDDEAYENLQIAFSKARLCSAEFDKSKADLSAEDALDSDKNEDKKCTSDTLWLIEGGLVHTESVVINNLLRDGNNIIIVTADPKEISKADELILIENGVQKADLQKSELVDNLLYLKGKLATIRYIKKENESNALAYVETPVKAELLLDKTGAEPTKEEAINGVIKPAELTFDKYLMLDAKMKSDTGRHIFEEEMAEEEEEHTDSPFD